MDTLSFHWKMMAAMRRFKEQTERLTHPFCLENDLTPQQLRILMTLHFEGSQTMSALAKSACIAGTNTSAMCKRLDQDGLVLRQRDTADERQVNVSLTMQGERVTRCFLESCADTFQIMDRCFSPEDTEVITAGVDRLLTRLDECDFKEKAI